MGVTEAHAPAEDSLRSGGQSHSLGPGAEASSLPPPSLKGLSCAKNSTRSLCPSSWPRRAWMSCASFFIRTQWEVGVRGRTRCHNLQGPLQNDTSCLCFRWLRFQDGDSRASVKPGALLSERPCTATQAEGPGSCPCQKAAWGLGAGLGEGENTWEQVFPSWISISSTINQEIELGDLWVRAFAFPGGGCSSLFSLHAVLSSTSERNQEQNTHS